MDSFCLLLWAPHENRFEDIRILRGVALWSAVIHDLLSHTQRARRLANAHLIPPSRHYPPPNSNFIWQWLNAHAIFLHFHRHLSLFEWSLLILARTLIWNRIWTTHMQRCNSNKFKLASMDFWYSERHDIRTGLEASAVDSHSTLNHFLVLWNYHCRFTVDWKWTLERM